jgi:RNA polymerase sigma factor (sigma-70 family)
VFGVRVDAFRHAMQNILNQKFDGDVMLMAKRTRLRYAECDAYLHSYLPTTFGDVVALEARIGVRHGTLANPWLADYMTLLEVHHPLSKSSDPIVDKLTFLPKRRLARLVRLAILRVATSDALSSVVNSATWKKETGRYKRLLKLFDAEFPVTAASLKEVYDFIVRSGAATEGETRAAIGLYVNAVEKWEERTVGSPVLDPEGKEFDHRHMDILDVAEKMERGDGGVSLLLFAPSFLDPWQIAEASAEGAADFATTFPNSRKAARLFVSPDPDLVVRPLSSMMTATEEMVLRAERSRAIDKVVSTLWPQEQSVLGLRFGYGFTVEEVSSELGIGERSVRQIEAHAFRKLRRPFLAKQLEPFLHEPEKIEDMRRLERARRWFEKKDEAEKLDTLRRLERARRWFEEKEQATIQKGEKPKPEDDDPDDGGGKGGGTPAPSGLAGSGSPSPAGSPQQGAKSQSVSEDKGRVSLGSFWKEPPPPLPKPYRRISPAALRRIRTNRNRPTGPHIMTGAQKLFWPWLEPKPAPAPQVLTPPIGVPY